MTKFKKRYAWLASAGLLLALLLVASISIAPAIADGPPGLPHQFYGNVTTNGSQAATGTAVASFVGGVASTTTTVDGLGHYNIQVTGTDGQTVTFNVGGTLAPQTFVYQTGGITQLNLAVSTTSLNVATNSATGVSSMVATLNGNLSDMGGFSPVNVSFQYGTTPSYGLTTATQAKTSTGTFSTAISGLIPLTTYYFRAVATGSSTTVYGAPLTFITGPSTLSVSTTAASGIAVSSATLNGNLNDLGPGSPSINVYFQWGPSQYYGYTTPAQSKTSYGAFSATISSLVAGSTYHYRAVAQGATTVYGEDTTFITQTGTLSVQTNPATSISSSSAMLNATLISLGGAASGTVYFQYGTTASYGNTTPLQARSSGGDFNASISGLSPATTYHFQAVAQAGGNTVYGADASFTTLNSGGSGSPPHQFYGNVYANGALAAAGTTVAAYVGGVPAATTSTDSSGRYGYTTLFLVPGAPGIVTFYVNGVLVPQMFIWVSGGVTPLNLISCSGSGCCAGFSITTSSLPNGTISSSYSATLQTSGGTSPYAWSVISGSLPAGLTLSGGTISGTPTTNGLASFTVQVTDSAPSPCTTTRALSICIGGSCGSPGPGQCPGTKLVGADDISQLGNEWPNYFVLTRFTAVASGSMTRFSVKGGTNSGNVKVAIYADNGGSPGALLNANNSGQAVTANQWNCLTIPATSVTAGTAYWLAINMDSYCIGYAAGSSGGYKYESATYSTFAFPNPAGTGLSTGSWLNIIAGY